jgi:ribA/ribD-fused uncharacterized protein
LVYPTVEHAFQAAKTLDPTGREMIRRATSPKQAKALGYKVKLRPDWESVKLNVMEQCLREKFKPGTQLSQELLATGSRELVEGNTWNDTFWGVCRGQGKNHLGRLLMKIRKELEELS